MKITLLLAASLLASCLAGCGTELTSGNTRGVPLEPNERAASLVDVSAVLVPVPLARVEDYVTTEDTFRVMGIEHGDDQVGTYAVVSNTKTWSTRNVAVGDAWGRNHTVTKIEDGLVELGGRSGKTTLAVGKDAVVTRVLHKYDRVVRYRGKNDFTFAPRVAAELAQKGIGIETEEVTALPEAGVKLVTVDASLLAFALGFKAGDIVLSIDEQPCTTANISALFGKFANGADIGVRVIRDGAVRSVRYFAP